MCKELKKIGFMPICDKDSRVLILGSFPSVKSREIEFYYGNKQNRFWKTVCNYFDEDVPESVEDKRKFLSRRHIALWDIVTACKIDGSADLSIKEAEIADLNEVFSIANIQKIFLNGTLAYKLFLKEYSAIDIPYEKLPSTSPANPRFDGEIWRKAFDDIFGFNN